MKIPILYIGERGRDSLCASNEGLTDHSPRDLYGQAASHADYWQRFQLAGRDQERLSERARGFCARASKKCCAFSDFTCQQADNRP